MPHLHRVTPLQFYCVFCVLMHLYGWPSSNHVFLSWNELCFTQFSLEPWQLRASLLPSVQTQFSLESWQSRAALLPFVQTASVMSKNACHLEATFEAPLPMLLCHIFGHVRVFVPGSFYHCHLFVPSQSLLASKSFGKSDGQNEGGYSRTTWGARPHCYSKNAARKCHLTDCGEWGPPN